MSREPLKSSTGGLKKLFKMPVVTPGGSSRKVRMYRSMKNGPLISIIVPVYNVEKYLAKCLDSVLAQTYQNIEVICIEDCSTDGTKRILNRYSRKHQNIQVIYNTQNTGLGESRNIGIRACRGKLVAFLDSDDYIPENFIQELYKAFKRINADVAICDILLHYESPKENQQDIRQRPYTRKPTNYGFVDYGMAATACNKLFKTKLFNGNLFPKGIQNEDVPTILSILTKAKIAYTPKTFYSYVQRENSLQNSEVDERRLDAAKAVKLFIEKVGNSKKNQKYIDLVVFHQWIVILWFVVPKQNNFRKRLALIKKYVEASEEQGLNIAQNPIYLECVSALGGADRRFVKSFINGAKAHRFFLVSLLMAVDNWRAKNKDKGICRLLFEPYLLPKIISDRLTTFKRVVRNNITITDLIKEAKRQSKLQSDITISAVIPNYNYADFMKERIYSILCQTEKVSEIIILDDVSTDNSIAVCNEIVQSLSPYIDIRIVANKVNNGVFRQWYKGFKLAKGEYVWICEADDYCDKQLLEQNMKPLKSDRGIVLSYSQTAVINENGKIQDPSLKDAIDIRGTGHWDNNFIANGKKELIEYAYLNNEVANVSATLIKKSANWREYFRGSFAMKQAGDWQIYNNIMLKGKVAYNSRPLNYYRMHGDNVSAVTKKQLHYNEIKQVHKKLFCQLGDKYPSNKQMQEIATRYDVLIHTWGGGRRR
jgi:glycosyltransferase involved in cell wall biosynthesis